MTARHKPSDDHAALKGIQEVAKELGLTMRALRFYEDKGLIAPQRVGTTRIYGKREVARVRLVQRGRRLGFTVREIQEFLDLYDADPEHVEQMRLLIVRVRERLAELEQRRAGIEEAIAELREMERETLESLEKAGKSA
ncbi:MAG: MerR family DNA-binding transcriptional regulator [Sphingomonas sp.]|nr:MerR family DNA-binding transcriptional regulator [Sphingomonas sp.]